MRKDELRQYISLRKEIEELEAILSEDHRGDTTVHDVVTGSAQAFPWNRRCIQIEGVVPGSRDRIRTAYLQDYVNQICRANELREDIERFIASIDDSLTRRIFRKRFIQGEDWLTIAHDCGSDHESYPRKVVDRYLEKISGAMGEKNEL